MNRQVLYAVLGMSIGMPDPDHDGSAVENSASAAKGLRETARGLKLPTLHLFAMPDLQPIRRISGLAHVLF